MVEYETVGTQVEMVRTLMTPLALETASVLALEECVATTVPLEYGDGEPETEVAMTGTEVVGTVVTALVASVVTGLEAGVVVATTKVLVLDLYGQSVTVSAQE
jgi:hypothetical protein